MNWVNAIRGRDQVTCPFSYAAHLNEIMLLGVASLRAKSKLHLRRREHAGHEQRRGERVPDADISVGIFTVRLRATNAEASRWRAGLRRTRGSAVAESLVKECNMRATFVMLSLVVATVALSAQQNPFVGRWNLERHRTGHQQDLLPRSHAERWPARRRSSSIAPRTRRRWRGSAVEGNELVWQKGAGEGLLIGRIGTPRADPRVRPDLSRAARGREAGRLAQHAAAAVRAEPERCGPRRAAAASS